MTEIQGTARCVKCDWSMSGRWYEHAWQFFLRVHHWEAHGGKAPPTFEDVGCANEGC